MVNMLSASIWRMVSHNSPLNWSRNWDQRLMEDCSFVHNLIWMNNNLLDWTLMCQSRNLNQNWTSVLNHISCWTWGSDMWTDMNIMGDSFHRRKFNRLDYRNLFHFINCLSRRSSYKYWFKLSNFFWSVDHNEILSHHRYLVSLLLLNFRTISF